MRFSRARYVTLCQQSLVTAAVLAVGLSAAGVKTLDIVPQPGATAGPRQSGPGTPGASAGEALPDSPRTVESSAVDQAPVTPKVREVAVTTPARKAPQSTPQSTPQSSPKTSAREGAASQGSEPKPGVVETTPQAVQGYATIGVTWKHGVQYADDQIAIQVRTQKKGAWSKWMKVDYHDDHGPDGTSSEEEAARERPGTDALVIGDVDYVQMRAETTDGSIPPEMRLAIIDPGTGKMTKQAPAIDTAKLPDPDKADGGSDPQASGVTTLEGDGVSDDVTLSAMVRSPRPTIYSRAQWGANEKMREQSAPSYGTVKTGFVHHTVNANNYTAAQVPALLRGIYAYHTQSRGWRDIGYNYLVDRFGRIWEGRWGGVNRAVVGAHTLGYNEVSFAMSAIGNFDVARPPTAVLTAYAKLFAWKLSIYNIAANATGLVVKGRRLQAINGHRDVGQTACPGRYLYNQLPTIRTQARAIQVAAQKGGGAAPAPAPAPTPVFTSPTQAPLPAKAQPSTVSFPKSMNLAGSAYPDLVVKNSSGAVRVLPTGGQTGLRAGVGTPGPWASMTLLSAVNDVTGDGRGDVIGRSGGYTRIYRGDGAGHVSKTGAFATKRFNRANLLVGAGDWNKDGKNDLLVRMRGNGALYLVPGTGHGTFGASRLLARGWAGYTSTAVPGDVTGDGRPDLAAVKGGVMYVFPNVGVSRLGTPVRRQSVSGQYNAIVGGARDLSGDGVGDLMVRSSRTGQVGILTGKVRANWGSTLGMFGGAAGLKKLSAAQMSGSSQADLVGLNASGKQLVVMSNNGLVNTSALLPGNLTVPGASMVINVGDWNRDGKGDIITREQDGDRLVLRPGLGNGQFRAGVVMSNGWKTFANIIGVNDVTGDGRPDLVARTASGPMTIFPGNGKTGFQAPILAPAKLRVFSQIGAGSWSSASMPKSSFYGPGGAFVPFVGTTGGWLGRPYNWVVGPGDLNGDGVSDLVTRDTHGDLWLLPGTSSGYGAARFIASGFAGYDFIG